MQKRISLMAAIASVVVASAAHAVPVIGQISFTGYVATIGSTGMSAATGLDFVSGTTGSRSPGVAGGLTSFGQGYGSFAGLSCSSAAGGCGSIKDFLTLSGPISQFLTLTTGTSTAISFDLTSITAVTRDVSTNALTLRATGTINFTGLDPTAGTFLLSTQGDNLTSFSATTLAANVISEPMSLTLLGASLVAIGFARRRHNYAPSGFRSGAA